MKIINEKVDWLLDVRRKYVYRIFLNGNDEISITCQMRDDFENCRLNETIRTLTKDDFRKVSVEWINKTFDILRKECRA